MSSRGLKALLRFQTGLVFFWLRNSQFCGCLKFRFDWSTKRFEMLSVRQRAVRCIMFIFSVALPLLFASRTESIFESVFMEIILLPYPVNFFYKLVMQQQCTIRHLNELLKCILDTQKLTERHLIFSIPLYCTLLVRLLCFAVLVGFVFVVLCHVPVKFEECAGTFILLLFIILLMHPLIGVYTYSHFVCIELFCLRTVALDLNDYLSEWAQDFNFYQQLRVTEMFEPKLRDLSRIYRRLVRTLGTFNQILGEDAVGLLFMIGFAVVYLLESFGETGPRAVTLWLLLYFGCLWDVIYGYVCYRRILFELSRTQTLIEAVKLKPEYHMDQHMNYILGAVDIAKLGMDVPRTRASKAFCSVIGIISLKFACYLGLEAFRV